MEQPGSTGETLQTRVESVVAIDVPVDVGRRHGRYVVVDELGRGAMGKVVRAYDPRLHREVALKFMRTEADPVARARMLREAQAMARLSHPNVVAIYDFELDCEPPFIAMEVVEGQTLKVWLSEAKPAREDVIAAFIDAGRGLAAAHAAEMIHRDFKPSNVLRADDGRIRVMDFGLARSVDTASLSDSELGETTADLDRTDSARSLPVLTRVGSTIGTPAYMAPEQHHGHDADARSDQFSFCVALWEGLSGYRPFRGTEKELSQAKQRREVYEHPDARPISPRLKAALLRGLQPVPDDRFPSMDALLIAVSKTSRRPRWLYPVAAIGAGFAGWAGMGALEERRQAAECDALAGALDTAWNEDAALALVDVFGATGLPYAPEQSERVQDRLDAYVGKWRAQRASACRAEADASVTGAAAERVAMCFDDAATEFGMQVDLLLDPDEGVVRHALDSLWSLPRLERCSDPDALRQRPRPEDPRIRSALGQAREELARARVEQRMGHYERAMKRVEGLVTLGQSLPWEPLVAESSQQIAHIASQTGDLERADVAGQRAFMVAGANAEDDVAVAAAVSLAYLHGVKKSDPAAGRRWLELARLFHTRRGEDDPLNEAAILNATGAVSNAAGDYDEALDAHLRELEIREQVLPPDHPSLASARAHVGTVYYSMGRYAESLAIHRENLEQREAVLGSTHPELVERLNHIAVNYQVTGRYDEALEILEQALSIAKAAGKRGESMLCDLHNNLGNVYGDLGRYEDARDAHLRAVRLYREQYGETMPTARGLNNLANSYSDTGDPAKALETQRQALAIIEERLGPDHAHCGMLRDNMGVILGDLGRPDEALVSLKEGLHIREKALGPEHPEVALSLVHLADAYQREGRHPEAVAAYERGLIIRQAQRTGPENLAHLRFGLAVSAWEADMDRDRALQLARSAREDYAEAGAPYARFERIVADWLAEHDAS